MVTKPILNYTTSYQTDNYNTYGVSNVFKKSEGVTNGRKKISRKKGEVKIIGSKSLDYTFLDNDFLNLKYTNISHKNDEDNSNNVAPKDSKINKDIQRINKTDFEIAKSRYKGRITGGQSRQSHSSVYE